MPTILVVDDSAVDRQLVGGLLEKDDELQIEYAAHGAEALMVMNRLGIDLVVTDLVMPQMNGLELVAAVRREFPLVPVILTTSKGSEEIAVEALQKGAASYVPKRALARSLFDTVQRILAVSVRNRSHSQLMGCMTKSNSSFDLENDSRLFAPLVGYLQEEIARMAGGEEIGEATRRHARDLIRSRSTL